MSLSSPPSDPRTEVLELRTSPTLVLVHGAFHGSWCWEPVITQIQARGLPVATVELPFAARVKRDVAFLRRALTEMDEELIVCSHSYGGMIATLATSLLPHVRHLVYVAAYMLDLNEPSAWGMLQSLLPAPGTSMNAGVVDAAEARATFYSDCDATMIARALARLRPMPISPVWLQMNTIPAPAYRTIPSTYVICSEDRALSPSGQRAMAQAATYRVDLCSGHCPFFSAPVELTRVLLDICATGAPGSTDETPSP
jgi:pimeloyl-ACP methyl ester carboxylesterase